jgi:hypothetical protein
MFLMHLPHYNIPYDYIVVFQILTQVTPLFKIKSIITPSLLKSVYKIIINLSSYISRDITFKVTKCNLTLPMLTFI